MSVEQTPTLATTHGGEPAICLNDQGGGVMDVTSDKTQTLRAQTHGHPPDSGIYKADTSRTLDNNGGNPACNQGGMIVLEGNGARDSHKGDGYSESDTMYTLNTVEQHAVLWNGKADGASGDGVAFATVGDHENRPTDMTNLIVK